MKTYLVETYHPEIEFDEGSLVVALTPEACYQLDKAAIKYSIIEDYYDEAELSTHEDEYYQSQLNWIEGLDEFLQRNVEELKEFNLKLGTIYYLYLKGMVVDPIYVRCYTLKRLFEAVKPSAIVFVSQLTKRTSPDYRLQDNNQSYYSLVTSILCDYSNIRMTSIFPEPADKEKSEPRLKAVGRDINFIARLKLVLAKNSVARRVYYVLKRLHFIYSYSKKWLSTRQTKQKQLNIFMLTTAHLREDFVVDVLAKGNKVYFLSDGFITKYSFLRAKKHTDLSAKHKMASNIWQNTANLIDDDELIKWISEQCQLDVSEIVLTKLKYFISDICPEILNYFRMFTQFYQKNGIDFVITPHEVYPIEFAAVAAANYAANTKSVYLQHGGSIFAANFWNMMRLAHFNVDISSTKEIKEYFSNQCQANRYPTKLYSSPHRFFEVKRVNTLRANGKGIKKNRIVYLPTMLRGNYGRFDCAHYPDTWYYKLQKSIIKYFSARREYIFVWKGIPASDVNYNPIPNFIRDNNFSNIEIATNPFTEHLVSAGKVICDYPSTGFYESVIAGIPTMSLYHKAFKVRKSAVDYFGCLLKLYSDIPEAINRITEFLNSDPELYKTTIDMDDRSVIDILEEIGKRETSE